MKIREKILLVLCFLTGCFDQVISKSILGSFIYCSSDTSQMPLYDMNKDCQELLIAPEEKLIIPNESKQAKVFVVLKKQHTKHINNVSIFWREEMRIRSSWSLLRGKKKVIDKVETEINKHDVFLIKQGKCSLITQSTAKSDYGEDRMKCFHNTCKSGRTPIVEYPWFGESYASIINCYSKHILIEQENNHLKDENYGKCFAPDICADSLCRCRLNNTVLEWARTIDTYIKDNFEPKAVLNNVKVVNNRLMDTKNVAFAHIVAKEMNIIARNLTFKVNNTSQSKNFIQEMNNYNNDADLKRRLKRNSDHDKNRYVKFEVYKSTTDLYFTNNKFIIFWAQKTLKEGAREPEVFFQKLEDSFKDEILTRLNSNQTSKDMLSIIKHFAINECYAWKQSLHSFTYLNDEFVVLRDFRGMNFYVYVSNHLIYLPQCDRIHRINVLRGDFIKRDKTQCSKELPIVYFYDSQVFTGYLNRIGIISEQSSEVECKLIKQTYIFANYDIDLLPDKNYEFLPVTITRRGKDFNITMKKRHVLDHIDPFDYGKNHYGLRYSPELHKGAHMEPNTDVDVLDLTYEDEITIKHSDGESNEEESQKNEKEKLDDVRDRKNSSSQDFLMINIFLVIILNIICLIFYNHAKNKVYSNIEGNEVRVRQKRSSFINDLAKKNL